MPDNTGGAPGLAGYLQRGWAGSPIGGAVNAFRDGGMRGGFSNLWNQSLPGRIFNGIRGLGDGVQGNGLAGFLGRGSAGSMPGLPASYNNTTGLFPVPEGVDVGPPAELAGQGWESVLPWLQQAMTPGSPGFQGGGLANRPSDRVVTGGANNMGGSSLNPLLAGDTAGGLGRLMNSFNPWRQSGISFGDRQRSW